MIRLAPKGSIKGKFSERSSRRSPVAGWPGLPHVPPARIPRNRARKTTKVQNYNKFLEDQHRGVMPAGLKLNTLREFANRPPPPVTP